LSTIQTKTGVIQRADVERTVRAKPLPVTPEVPSGMRRAIAAAMVRSNREIPHYYLETRIDMSRALGWLEAQNQKRPVKERILPVVLLLKAVALALRDVPELNGFWIDDRHLPQIRFISVWPSRSSRAVWSHPPFTMPIRKASTSWWSPCAISSRVRAPVGCEAQISPTRPLP
jgi:hypothetical protein